MKIGDANALDIGFWWARCNYDGKLTIIEVFSVNTKYSDPFDDDWNDLDGMVMGRDYSESIDDLIESPGGPKCSYVFIERVKEPA
jgi:hypothetical protein